MSNTNGKRARKTGGNRYATKKQNSKPRTGKYAQKVNRWVSMEKGRE